MAGAKFDAKAAIAAAKAAMKAGDAAAALAQVEAVLARFPGHSTAKGLLSKLQRAGATPARLTQADVDRAVAQLQSGDFAGAELALRGLVRLAAGEAILHNLLGVALAQQGKAEDAIKAFSAARRLRPADAEIRGNLGGALTTAGRPAEALPHLEAAAAAQPGNAMVQKNLGDALHMLGRSDEALGCFDRAIGLSPGYLNALVSKSGVLRDMLRGPEALAVVVAGLDLDPAYLDLRLMKAKIEADSDREHDAIATYRAVLADHPDLVDERYRLAVMLTTFGEMDEAEALLRDCLARRPGAMEPFRTLTTVRKLAADDPAVLRAAEVLADADAADEDRMHAAFGLSRVYLATGPKDAAFAALHTANRLRRKTLTYSTAETDREFAAIRRAFSAKRVAELADDAQAGGEHIFIVGMYRSGTTLMEDIIGRHSAVAPAGERAIISSLTRAEYAAWETADATWLANFRARYRANLAPFLARADRVTDKLPANFRFIGLLRAAFPKATIIHMMREPRDVLWSNYREMFVDDGNGFVYDLKELGEYYVRYHGLMDFLWAEFPGQFLDVRYEDLVADTEAQARRVLDHAGLGWEGAVLERGTTGQSVKTASVAQVRGSIYSSSVGGWRKYEDELRPMLEVLDAAGL